MWVDSHCHIQPDHARVHSAADLLTRARAAGVDWMVCVGTDLASSRAAVELAAEHAEVFASVGLHPHDAERFNAEWPQLCEIARSAPNVVGIGECGFDLYYEHAPRDQQGVAFRAQIELALELDQTLVIHTRDAWDDTFDMLCAIGVPERTIVHCFSGGPVEAARALELGCYLSFSGIVSFKSADDVRAAAAMTPPDRLLVETDSPFLAPVPFRGKDNEPCYVGHVGTALADARGVRVEEIAQLTSANAVRAFACGGAIARGSA